MRLTEPFSFARIAEVDSVEQSAQLELGELHGRSTRSRPGEGPALESLRIDAESGSVPLEDLESVASAVAKDEECAGKGRQFELVLDECGESIEGLAHVGDPRGEEDLDVGAQSEHARTEAKASSS